MMRYRPKLGTERGTEWRCCFCFHVRTGTIIIGSWHLVLHLMALMFLAAIVRDSRLVYELERESLPGPDWSDVGKIKNVMPTPLSNVDGPPTSYPQHVGQPKDHAFIYNDVDVGALVTVCTLAVTLMLIYGAVRGKPAHLLPFFCLQIFDFAITVLTATGYLCYLRSIHRLVAETRRVPWRNELLQLPAPALALIVLSAFLIAVLLKGYCINVVWRCYKYCTWRAATLHSLTPFVISSEGLSPCAPHLAAFPAPAPDYSSLLPDYDEALKQSPPPSYRAATLLGTSDPELGTIMEPTPKPAPTTAAKQAPASVPKNAPALTPKPAAPSAPPATDTIIVLPQLGSQSRV